MQVADYSAVYTAMCCFALALTKMRKPRRSTFPEARSESGLLSLEGGIASWDAIKISIVWTKSHSRCGQTAQESFSHADIQEK